MNRIVSLFFFLLSLQALAQRDFLVVFEGQVKDLLDQQNLYGVTLDVMQQDAVISKVISDESFMLLPEFNKELPCSCASQKDPI